MGSTSAIESLDMERRRCLIASEAPVVDLSIVSDIKADKERVAAFLRRATLLAAGCAPVPGSPAVDVVGAPTVPGEEVASVPVGPS